MNKVNNEIKLLDFEKVKKICSEREKTSSSLLTEKESFEYVLPIFRDYLEAFMNSIGMNFDFNCDQKLEGKIKYYSICANVNGLDDALLLKLNIEEDTYSINVRSISKEVPNTMVKMSFNDDGVDLSAGLVFRNTRNVMNINTVKDPAFKVVSFCDGRKILNKEITHEELQKTEKEENGYSKRMKMNN